MKKLSFAIVGAATLALAACGGQKEETQNIDENAVENLEATANDIANEAATLEDQANALDAEANTDVPATTDDANAADVNAM